MYSFLSKFLNLVILFFIYEGKGRDLFIFKGLLVVLFIYFFLKELLLYFNLLKD